METVARRRAPSMAEARARSEAAPSWARAWLAPTLATVIARDLRAREPDAPVAELVRRLRAEAPAGDPLAEAVVDRLERAQAAAARPASARGSALPSAIVLLLANLAPVYGVLWLDWPVLPLIALFWIENLIIGVLNVARMLTIDPRNPVLWLGKAFLVPFFCVHYGAFTLGHGMFVFGLFGEGGFGIGTGHLADWYAAVAALGLLLPALVLAASHAFSFAWNHLWRGEFRRATLTRQMTQPYRRVMVLHVAIILGGLGAAAFGSPLWALLLLVLLKAGVDVKAHLSEHRPAG